MTKITKNLNKIAFATSIFLASIEGEGHAQAIIEQQCAVNCVNTFNLSLACLATNSCQAAINTLGTCLSQSYVGNCDPNTKNQSFTTLVYQECATNYFTNTFASSFNNCSTTQCKGQAVAALATYMTKTINSDANCLPPSSAQ
ncbi:MAG: hypothetical protein HYX35_06025 [Proteobacteria bacterium]|nr:hypothetical protein [Pseudomonadota bacterium]